MMVWNGVPATFMKDKNGFLPIHVACSRHCSPPKLDILLAANPDSVVDRTDDGHSPLSLALSTATKSHPNNTLVARLKVVLKRRGEDVDEQSRRLDRGTTTTNTRTTPVAAAKTKGKSSKTTKTPYSPDRSSYRTSFKAVPSFETASTMASVSDSEYEVATTSLFQPLPPPPPLFSPETAAAASALAKMMPLKKRAVELPVGGNGNVDAAEGPAATLAESSSSSSSIGRRRHSDNPVGLLLHLSGTALPGLDEEMEEEEPATTTQQQQQTAHV